MTQLTRSRLRGSVRSSPSRRGGPRRAVPRRSSTAGHNNHAPNPERLQQIAFGYAPTLILEAAVHHGIFDRLDQGAQTVEQLGSSTGASVRGLAALLDALVGLDFLAKRGNRYALTPESASFLVSTKPAYLGLLFRHTVHQLLPQWLHLPEAVRTGRPANAVNQRDHGEAFFADFVEALFPLSYRASQVLGEYLRIPAATEPLSVLDIGAGSGVWGIALAHQSPKVRIRAVDWPGVLSTTQRIAQRHGVAERLHTVAGDLLEADFGTGHRVATIGHILHSEGRDRSRRLLKKTFEALAPGGTVAISEFVPNARRTGPPNALIFGVNMLLHTEVGDIFTFAEIAGWLKAAGFKKPRLLEAPAPSPLILATKPHRT